MKNFINNIMNIIVSVIVAIILVGIGFAAGVLVMSQGADAMTSVATIIAIPMSIVEVLQHFLA